MQKFLIMADLDSTFESYRDNGNGFNEFIQFVDKFEKENNVDIDLYFVSGTEYLDLRQRLNYFKENYPKIFNKIVYSIAKMGYIYDREGNSLGRVDSESLSYTKADGVSEIFREYGRFLAGACYIGDSEIDIPAFKVIKYYKNKFALNVYNLSPRSRRDKDVITPYLDFYSNAPRIDGCVDVLQQMSKKIKLLSNQAEL